MIQSRASIKLGLILNTHSILTLSTHLGKSLATRLPDISITSTVVMLFSTSHQPHSEDNSKITTSSLPNLSGTGTLKTENSVGIQATLPSSMLTTPSVNILIELTASLEVNVKEETLVLNKDGLWLKFKRYLFS